MNLHRLLLQREHQGRPIRAGLIGAGKFASMYLAQVPRTPGIHIAAIADLAPDNARANLARVGWAPELTSAPSLDAALAERRTFVTDDWQAVATHPALDVVIEATGHPVAAVDHIAAALDAGRSVVNVTVEADALCGPVLARRAAQAGVVYSLAYGDQPAIACELVDMARAAGFPVVAAGRGHKWRPQYAQSTPETVWDHWGLTAEQARAGGLNPKMFNSFLDGSKPAIESTAIANATGLTPAPWGLRYPAASIDDLPFVARPQSEGGQLHHKGQVEVINCLEADGRPVPYDIRMGVWVVIEGETEYIRRCFQEYAVKTDPSGRYACLYRRWHLIGLEVGISVASVALRREPTGSPEAFLADTVATAKRDLAVGDELDGEGGRTVHGSLLPATATLSQGALPLGLASGVRLAKPVAAGAVLRWDDIEPPPDSLALRLRRELEEKR